MKINDYWKKRVLSKPKDMRMGGQVRIFFVAGIVILKINLSIMRHRPGIQTQRISAVLLDL